jgi:hypothetical protein
MADFGLGTWECSLMSVAIQLSLTCNTTAAVCIYRDTNLRTLQRAAIPNPITNAKPTIRPDGVLLLQPWSTALIQSTNSRIAPTAIPFSHIADPPLETVVWANARVGASAAVTG